MIGRTPAVEEVIVPPVGRVKVAVEFRGREVELEDLTEEELIVEVGLEVARREVEGSEVMLLEVRTDLDEVEVEVEGLRVVVEDLMLEVDERGFLELLTVDLEVDVDVLIKEELTVDLTGALEIVEVLEEVDLLDIVERGELELVEGLLLGETCWEEDLELEWLLKPDESFLGESEGSDDSFGLIGISSEREVETVVNSLIVRVSEFGNKALIGEVSLIVLLRPLGFDRLLERSDSVISSSLSISSSNFPFMEENSLVRALILIVGSGEDVE